MNENFYDIAYMFSADNPFPDDSTKQKLNVLKKMVKQELSIPFEQTELMIKFYDLNDGITQLYNTDDKEKPITETFMFNDIKQVVQTIPELRYFNTWCDKYDPLPEPGGISGGNTEQTANKQPEQPKPQETETKKPATPSPPKLTPEETKWESVIPITPSKFDYSKTSGLTNYDITNEKPLSYEDIRKLTVNIARSKLKNIVEKSEQVLALEKAKRKELMNNIQKYKNIKVIGAMVEDNIHEMNLDQLEHTLAHCEKLFQSQKLKEMIKRGANFGSLLTSTVFPDGIKVGKSKRIKTKGAVKTIIDSVFDSQSTIGVAFQNIVEKHNWNVTDEMVLMLSLGEMLISNIKVEKIEQPTPPTAEPPAQPTNHVYNTYRTIPPTRQITNTVNNEKTTTENNDEGDESELQNIEEEEYSYYSEAAE